MNLENWFSNTHRSSRKINQCGFCGRDGLSKSSPGFCRKKCSARFEQLKTAIDKRDAHTLRRLTRAAQQPIPLSNSRLLVPKKTKKERRPVKIDLYSEENKQRWLALRYEAFRTYGRTCSLCGANNRPLHVDHVKPKSYYPELAFSIKNLQILCDLCNLGKGNRYEDDWRQ